MSDITSNAYNFAEHVTGSVDHRTGSYSASINLGEFISHGGAGKSFPLTVSYSASNSMDSGFGRGWSLPTAGFNKHKQVLSLSSGQSFKIRWDELKKEYEMPYRRIKDIRVFIYKDESDNTNQLHIVNKDGSQEFIDYEDGILKKIVSPNGLELHFEHEYHHDRLLLWRIHDGDNSGNEIEINWWDNKYKTTVIHKINNETFKKYTFHKFDKDRILKYFQMDGLKEYTYFEYQYFPTQKYKMLSKVTFPTGMVEEIVYLEKLHMPQGAPFKKMPVVYKHTVFPGQNQDPQVSIYTYSDTNYFGFGSDRKWISGEDNLFYSASDYKYYTMETINGTKKIVRIYNKYHMNVEVRYFHDDFMYKFEENIYYAEVGLSIYEQPPNYALVKERNTTVYNENGSYKKYIFRTKYDDYGNVVEEHSPNGNYITREYYPADEDSSDCPKEPYGFVNYVKEETFHPNESIFRYDTIHTDKFYYKKLDKLSTGSTMNLTERLNYYIVFSHRVESNEIEVRHEYHDNKLEIHTYGKIKSEKQLLNNKETITSFEYELIDDDKVLQKTIQIKTHDGYTSKAIEEYRLKDNKKIKETNVEKQTTKIEIDQLGREKNEFCIQSMVNTHQKILQNIMLRRVKIISNKQMLMKIRKNYILIMQVILLKLKRN